MTTNLSGSNIQDTFQQVIHTPNNTTFFNGTGSAVPLALENTAVTFTSITASGNITANRLIGNGANITGINPDNITGIINGGTF